MLPLARLEDEPKSGAIFVYLFVSATHTYPGPAKRRTIKVISKIFPPADRKCAFPKFIRLATFIHNQSTPFMLPKLSNFQVEIVA